MELGKFCVNFLLYNTYNLFIYLFIYLFSRAQSLMSNQVRSAPSSVSGWGGNHYFQNQARCRLDARLWLTCRLALARGLAEEDSGMGKLGGSVRSVTSSIGSCLHHCQQGNERESILQNDSQFIFLGLLMKAGLLAKH